MIRSPTRTDIIRELRTTTTLQRIYGLGLHEGMCAGELLQDIFDISHAEVELFCSPFMGVCAFLNDYNHKSFVRIAEFIEQDRRIEFGMSRKDALNVLRRFLDHPFKIETSYQRSIREAVTTLCKELNYV